MKNPLPFILTLFITTFLHGQNLDVSNIENFLDKKPTSLRIHNEEYDFFSNPINTKAIKGTIRMDSVRFYNVEDDISQFLFVGELFYDSQGRVEKIVWDELDPIFNVREIFEKYEFTYTSTGKIKTKYQFEGLSNQWIKVGGEEYYYNLMDELDSLKIYTYYNGYKIQYNIKFKYDLNGNLIEILQKQWDYHPTTSMTYLKQSFTFNQNNLLITDTLCIDINGYWYAYEAHIRTYNSQNLIESYIPSMRLSDSIWDRYNKLTYSYNQLALVDTMHKFRIDTLGNFYLAFNYIYTYTPSNKPSTAHVYWISNSGQAIPSLKSVLSYSVKDSLIRSEDYEFDTTLQSWKMLVSRGKLLDADENTLINYYCRINFNTGLWDSLILDSSIYNNNISTLTNSFPLIQDIGAPSTEYIDPNSNNLLKERTLFKFGYLSIDTIPREHYTFYYSGIPNTYPNGEQKPMLYIYPNPATDWLTINCSVHDYDLKMFSSNGNLVYQGHNEKHIKLGDFLPGLYLVELSNAKIHITRKIIIQ